MLGCGHQCFGGWREVQGELLYMAPSVDGGVDNTLRSHKLESVGQTANSALLVERESRDASREGVGATSMLCRPQLTHDDFIKMIMY